MIGCAPCPSPVSYTHLFIIKKRNGLVYPVPFLLWFSQRSFPVILQHAFCTSDKSLTCWKTHIEVQFRLHSNPLSSKMLIIFWKLLFHSKKFKAGFQCDKCSIETQGLIELNLWHLHFFSLFMGFVYFLTISSTSKKKTSV